MKLKDVFEKSVQFFKDKKIETARLDVELLLSHVLKIQRLQIYLKYDQPLTEAEINLCREVVRRRSQGESVAYIVGEKGFYGDAYSVGLGVLVPRPETELIVEEALQYIRTKNITKPRVLDLGAGSGCIGFSILRNLKEATLVSIEKSAQAFEYLKKNQTQLELMDRSVLHLSDVMQFQNSSAEYDVIVANPPYIDSSDSNIQASVKNFEPHEALFSSDMGYNDLLSWSKKFSTNLASPGIMLFEMGHLQGEKLASHFRNLCTFDEIKVLKDLSGLDRIVKAVNNG
jgi:release factor glutamine methyltransferase